VAVEIIVSATLTPTVHAQVISMPSFCSNALHHTHTPKLITGSRLSIGRLGGCYTPREVWSFRYIFGTLLPKSLLRMLYGADSDAVIRDCMF